MSPIEKLKCANCGAELESAGPVWHCRYCRSNFTLTHAHPHPTAAQFPQVMPAPKVWVAPETMRRWKEELRQAQAPLAKAWAECKALQQKYPLIRVDPILYLMLTLIVASGCGLIANIIFSVSDILTRIGYGAMLAIPFSILLYLLRRLIRRVSWAKRRPEEFKEVVAKSNALWREIDAWNHKITIIQQKIDGSVTSASGG